MAHSEAFADEDSISILHPDSLADLRTEMGSVTCVLRAHNGRFRLGDHPITETYEIDGWKVVSNLSTGGNAGRCRSK